MKRLLLASAIATALPVYAGSSNVNLGSSMTTGPVSNAFSLSAASNNPAMAPLVMPKDEKLRMSYFPTFGFNLEYGQVDNFEEDLEELTDILDDPTSTDEDPQDVLDRFNGVLQNVGEEGYIRGSFALHAPLAPLYYKSEKLGGTIGVDLSILATGGFGILDDELSFNEKKATFSTATSIYLKAGTETTLSLSYGRPLLKKESGTLYGGAKLKFINMELSKQLLPLETLDSDEIDDLIVDRYDENLEKTSDFGLDLGLVWDASWYRIGLTLENLNEPEFGYGEVGANCESQVEGTDARTTCENARYFTQQLGRIAAVETHTKFAMARADAVFKVTERLQLSAAADLAEYNDVIGFEHQWYHLAASYDSDSAIIPSIRVGYQENLSGTKTSSLNMGATLFSIVNLDLQWGLDTIDIDGDTAPRTFGFSLSVQESF